MRNDPKEFTLYWTSKFSGPNRSYSTEKYKANMKTFDTLEGALTCYRKLVDLQKVGGTYQSRIVHHVGDFLPSKTLTESAE